MEDHKNVFQSLPTPSICLSIYLFRGCGEPKPVANTWRGVETLDSSLVHHRATYNHSHQHIWSHMMHMWSSYRRARAITTSSTTRPQNKLFLVYTFSSICTQWNMYILSYTVRTVELLKAEATTQRYTYLMNVRWKRYIENSLKFGCVKYKPVPTPKSVEEVMDFFPLLPPVFSLYHVVR